MKNECDLIFECLEKQGHECMHNKDGIGNCRFADDGRCHSAIAQINKMTLHFKILGVCFDKQVEM